MPLLVDVGCGGGNGSSNGGLTVNISANSTTVDLGESVTLTWSSTKASSCLASSASPESDWTALVATGGSATVTPTGFGGEVYSLTCAAPSGSFATGSTSVTVNSPATGIVNGTNTPTEGPPAPSTAWAANSCVFDGHTIANLTVVSGGNSGQMIG
jgi:hypothetical protein